MESTIRRIAFEKPTELERNVVAITFKDDKVSKIDKRTLEDANNIKIDSEGINYIGERKDTLKLTFPGRKTSMIKFHIKEEDKELLDPKGGTLTLTAIGKCVLNHYNGNVTPQILLEDFEITKRTQWDF